MPYADKEKLREAQRRWYREKYQRDEPFRLAEAVRKADWIQTDDGKASNREATKRAKKKVKP